MIEKIKSYANYIFGAVIVILSGILFNRNRKLQQTESELTSAITKAAIQENDHDREIAKEHADNLVDDYARKRAEYDENRTGGGS